MPRPRRALKIIESALMRNNVADEPYGELYYFASCDD
jgi:hypothetical protein